MQLRCCLFASKQRLLFESPALFEGVNIIRMGVNIVRMHRKAEFVLLAKEPGIDAKNQLAKYQKTVVLVQFNQLTIRYLHEFFVTLCLPQYKVIDDV